MRVLIILAVATLMAAAPQVPREISEYAAESKYAVISGDTEAQKINLISKAASRSIRSTDDSESTTDDVNEGVSEANDLSKEITEEAHWAAEEKKWQERAEADTESAKLDGEAASSDAGADNSKPVDDEEENQGTEATELEDSDSHEQEESSSEAEDSDESLIPAILVTDLDLHTDFKTRFPPLVLIPNDLTSWTLPPVSSRNWILQYPYYHHY